MLTFSAVRGVSLMYMQRFLSGSDAEAEHNIQNAIALDNEDALFKFYYGVQLYNLTRVEEAIPLLRISIDHGIVIPTGYFYLASAQIIARKTAEAEQTFVESLRIFPQSVFLRTAYASFLKKEGKYPQAEIEYKKAYQINPKQARSWQIAHDEGLEKLSQAVVKDKNLIEGMDLKPFGANMVLSNFHRQYNPRLMEK
jgi:tetratricopeptide (TPR) repeat protein